MGIYTKTDESGLYVESSYEHKILSGLLKFNLPKEAQYKGKMVPYHAHVLL